MAQVSFRDWFRNDGGEGESGSVRPEIFECEVAALFLVKNVNDNISEVGHDPVAQREAVDAKGADSVIFFEGILELSDDGFEVRFGRSGADDEEVGERGNFPQVEDDNVICLFCVYGLCAEGGDFVGRWSVVGRHAGMWVIPEGYGE